MVKKILLLLHIVILTKFSYSNNIVHDYDIQLLTKDDGLTSNRILDIIQDRQGFLWIATVQGLNKYDGYSYRYFLHDSLNPNSLLSDDVNSLTMDDEGMIYMGQYGEGVSKLDPETEKFTHLTQGVEFEDDDYLRISQLLYLEDKIWIASSKNILYYYDNIKKTVVKKDYAEMNRDLDGNIKGISPSSIYIKDSKELQVPGWSYLKSAKKRVVTYGVSRFNSKSNSFTTIKTLNELELIQVSDVKNTDKIITFPYHILINRAQKLHKLDFSFNEFKNITTIYNSFLWNDLIWLLTNKGLFTLNIKDSQKGLEYVDLKQYYGMSSSFKFECFYIDNSNNLWIGTDFGLLKFKYKRTHIETLFQNTIPDLRYDYVDDVVLFKDQCLYIVKDGVYLDDTKIHQGTIVYNNSITHDGDNRIWYTHTKPRKSLFCYNYQDSTKYEVRGTLPFTGFIKYDSISKLLWATSSCKKDFGSFIGPTDCFKAFDPNDDYSTKYSFDIKKVVDVLNIKIHGDDFLFVVADTEGTKKINLKTGEITEMFTEASVSKYYRYAMCIREISNHRLAIGTRGGIIIYDYLKDSYELFSLKKDHSNYMIGSIEEDKDKNLWLFTDWGIIKYDVINNKFYFLYKIPLLFNTRLKISSAYSEKENSIYFGSVKGLKKVMLDSLTTLKKKKFPIRITNLYLDGESMTAENNSSVLPLGLSYLDELVIPSGVEKIKITYSDNSFNDQSTSYRHKLVNYDESWIDTQKNPFAEYSRLPSGKYYLHIQYTNNRGEWSQEDFFIRLVVKPSRWASGTALALYALLFFGLVAIISFWVYTFKKNYKEKRNNYIFKTHKNKMFSLKERLYKDTLFQVKHVFSLARLQKNTEELTINMNSIETNINRIIDKRIAGIESVFDLHKTQVEFEDVALRAYEDYVYLAKMNKINYSFDCQNIPGKVFIDEGLVYEIYSGLLSIVFKYIPYREDIVFALRGEKDAKGKWEIQMTIDDTSSGFPIEVSNKLYGNVTDALSTKQSDLDVGLIAAMIKVHSGNIDVSVNENGGNRISVVFPDISGIN